MSAGLQMATVGILGGGQLARMMVLAGLPLGLRFALYDPAADACAGQVAALRSAPWDAGEALTAFAADIDVATFDFENVPAASLDLLGAQVPVWPGRTALATTQDRRSEKTCFNRQGVATARFAAVSDRAGLEAAVQHLGLPAILKTCRLGYDGKGQFRLRTPADVDAAWAALGAQAESSGLILEAFVPFVRELSVLAARSREGAFATWPITENWHVDGVLSASLAPAPVSEGQAAHAIAQARQLAEALAYVGVFALELFDLGDALLANEMAPRVHNSGHWTIEGAQTSQFENHLRAVLGWPLGDTSARGMACMLNFVGEMPDARAALGVAGLHWHDYGKAPRSGRKLGHATVVGEDAIQLAERLSRAGEALGRQAQVAPVLERLRQMPQG